MRTLAIEFLLHVNRSTYNFANHQELSIISIDDFDTHLAWERVRDSAEDGHGGKNEVGGSLHGRCLNNFEMVDDW